MRGVMSPERVDGRAGMIRGLLGCIETRQVPERTDIMLLEPKNPSRGEVVADNEGAAAVLCGGVGGDVLELALTCTILASEYTVLASGLARVSGPVLLLIDATAD